MSYDVVIAGAGPVGLLLAAELKLAGVSVIVLERLTELNMAIDGFGNKDPGNRRATQYRSQWNVLHPGRRFAEKLADSAATPETFVTRLREYFAGQVVPLIPTDEAADIGTTEDGED